MEGMDGSIIMNRAVWKASGHEATFSDPMVDCRLTKQRYRADQIEAQTGEVYWYSGASRPKPAGNRIKNSRFMIRKGGKRGCAPEIARILCLKQQTASPQGANLELTGEQVENVENSARFNPTTVTLTEPRAFNLMFKSYAGPVESDDNMVYLRPETRAGHLRPVQEHPGNLASKVALRHRPDRQGLPQ